MLRQFQRRSAALCPRFADVMTSRAWETSQTGCPPVLLCVRHKSHRSRSVRPVLLELNKRREKVELNNRLKQVNPIDRRSSFIEWNLSAELFAFSARLGENIPEQLLLEAFTTEGHLQAEREKQQELNLSVSDTTKSNDELSGEGEAVLQRVVLTWLRGALPALPEEGIQALRSSLLSIDMLANISFHIGTKDLIMAVEYPPLKEDYAKSFKAVVGALCRLDEERGIKFIHDLVIAQLVGKDVNELWDISNPMKILLTILKNEGRGEPEARLLWKSGPKTLLANFTVGIYSDKELIGECSGESMEIAEEMAVRDALRNLFRTGLDMRPLPVENVYANTKPNKNIEDWTSDNIPNLVYN